MNAVNILLSSLLASLWQLAYGKYQIPSFQKLMLNYPGYKHFGGRFTHNRLKWMIGVQNEKSLLHDTSALRLSYSLNKIGGEHSLGKELIRLSKYGKDSVTGKNGLQYIYHPIAYGPYLADKYGYPNISVLHQIDPIATKNKFYGKQGILQVITYTKKGNKPKGHIALWDCDRIYQAKDWITKHTLITVEFWQSPDSDCSKMSHKTSPFKEQQKSWKMKYWMEKYRLKKMNMFNNSYKNRRNYMNTI